jgi:hypothetical protein
MCNHKLYLTNEPMKQLYRLILLNKDHMKLYMHHLFHANRIGHERTRCKVHALYLTNELVVEATHTNNTFAHWLEKSRVVTRKVM